MRSATMWLGMAGGVLMAVLLFAGVKGSLVIGILFVTIISWIPGHSASFLGAGSAVGGGYAGHGRGRTELRGLCARLLGVLLLPR